MTNRGADGAYGSAATVQGCVSFGTLPVDVFLISRVGKHMPKLSNNAIEIKAKMKALKRWLLDSPTSTKPSLKTVAWGIAFS